MHLSLVTGLAAGLAIIAVVVFVLAIPFIAPRSALVFAPVVVGSAAVGATGVFLASFRLHLEPILGPRDLTALVGAIGAAALANAAFNGWLFLSIRRLVLARHEAGKQPAMFE